MPAIVTVRELRKNYGHTAAIAGVSFTIEPGEIFGLLGPNGAGKTTTLECVIGLCEPDSGAIEVCGCDARKNPAEVKQQIGVALQSTALPDQITPREALRLFGRFYAQRAEPAELLERFGLHEKADARFVTLSGGQRQRLALALAFVNRPRLVILDEPTTALDPQARRALQADIKRMKQEGYTVLLTTHFLDEAEELCDRVAIIDRGRVVAVGAPNELTARSAGRQTITLVTARPLPPAQLASLPGIDALQCDGNEARWRTSNATTTLAALTRLLEREKVEILDLHVSQGSLEEFFIGLTRASDTPRAVDKGAGA